MKTIESIILAAFAAVAVCSCEGLDGLGGEGVKKNVKIRDIQFGTRQDQKKLTDIFHDAGKDVNPDIVPFTDSEKFGMTDGFGGDGKEYDKFNKVTYSEEAVRVYIKPTPENAAVSGFEVLSSDEKVLKIKEKGFNYVDVETVSNGYCDLQVTLSGSKNELTKVYPVKVVNSVDMRYFCTPYWFGNIKTKVHWKPRHATEGVTHELLEMTDSVTVIGYCEWYDFEKFGRTPQVIRDTTTYPLNRHYESMRRWTRKLLRDVTPTIRKYRKEMRQPGTRIVTNDEGHPDTVACTYRYIVEQLIVDMNIVSEDEFTEFITSIRGSVKKRSHETIIGPVVIEDENGNAIADDEDSEEDIADKRKDSSDEDSEGDYELEKAEINYFQVRVNDFLTPAQRDSIQRSIKDFKKKNGFDQELSDEEYDKKLEEINKHM